MGAERDTLPEQVHAATGTRGQPGAAPADDQETPSATSATSATASAGTARGGLLGWLTATPERLVRTVRTNWQFSIVIVAAVIMRIIVMLAYSPIMWFNDSYNYLVDAYTHVPDYVRPNGYPFFLNLLQPLHSVYPIAVVQAALGVAMGIVIYALLRHRGLPWWGAALPALPVMFDVFEMQLEHMITADSLFAFLVTIALVICCWQDRPSVPAMAVAGLLVGYATLVRSVGQPLLVVFVVAMLVRPVGWRRLVTLAVAGIVPIAAYMAWFQHTSGMFALTESQGTFLYSRVSTFAKCSKMNPPASLRVLCDPRRPSERGSSQEYLWANNTPLAKLTGDNNVYRFTPAIEGLTQKFAERAILSQPLSYAHVVFNDTVHTFGWSRQPDPQDIFGNGPSFRFGPTVPAVPWWAKSQPNDVPSQQMQAARQDFAGSTYGLTKVNQPWARLTQIYQRYVFMPGMLLGLLLLLGAAGILARWRPRAGQWRGGIALLPWLAGAMLIMLPPMTAGFSYRYVVAAVPVVCIAAGLVFSRRPGEKSMRALAADLGRHFGRGVPVKQE